MISKRILTWLLHFSRFFIEIPPVFVATLKGKYHVPHFSLRQFSTFNTIANYKFLTNLRTFLELSIISRHMERYCICISNTF